MGSIIIRSTSRVGVTYCTILTLSTFETKPGTKNRERKRLSSPDYFGPKTLIGLIKRDAEGMCVRESVVHLKEKIALEKSEVCLKERIAFDKESVVRPTER